MGEHSITGALCDRGGTHTDTSHPIHTPGSITGPGPPPSPPHTTPWAGREGGTAISRAITHSLIPLAASPSSQKKEKNHTKKEKSPKKKKKGAVPQHAPRARRNVRAQQKPRAAASRVPAGGFCWHSKVTPGAGYFLPDAAVLENFSPSWSRGAGGRFLTPIIPTFRCAR